MLFQNQFQLISRQLVIKYFQRRWSGSGSDFQRRQNTSGVQSQVENAGQVLRDLVKLFQHNMKDTYKEYSVKSTGDFINANLFYLEGLCALGLLEVKHPFASKFGTSKACFSLYIHTFFVVVVLSQKFKLDQVKSCQRFPLSQITIAVLLQFEFPLKKSSTVFQSYIRSQKQIVAKVFNVVL